MPRHTETQLAVLVAAASVLQVGESFLPHPLPGVRLGLANVLTMVVLVEMGPSCALQLSVLRTLVSSMVMGTFLTPTFVLSFAGGIASAVVMAAMYGLSVRGPVRFGLVGVSVAGAVSHVLVQLLLVYLLFIRSSGVLMLWPWLVIASVVTGVVTGLVVAQATARLSTREMTRARHRGSTCSLTRDTIRIDEQFGHVPRVGRLGHASASEDPAFEPSNPGVLHSLLPSMKLAGAVLFGLVVVFFSGYVLYGAAFALLLVLALVGRVKLSRLGRGLARVWLLALAALVMPVLFSNWGRVLFVLGPVRVTASGLEQGIFFAARLVLLVMATALVAGTTSPSDIAAGLGRLLAPLRHIGLKPDRLATVFGLSWTYYPVLMQNLRVAVTRPHGRTSLLDRLVHLPGDITADLYEFASGLATGESA